MSELVFLIVANVIIIAVMVIAVMRIPRDKTESERRAEHIVWSYYKWKEDEE